MSVLTVQLWLAKVRELTSQESPSQFHSSQLAELFTLDLQNPQLVLLQNDLIENSIDISSIVDAVELYDGDWPGFEQLTKSYLTACRSINPYSKSATYDAFIWFFADLQTGFANSRGAILGRIVRSAGKFLVPLSMELDLEEERAAIANGGSRAVDGKTDGGVLASKQRTSYIATVLLKIFNGSRSEKIDPSATVHSVSKKDVILYVGNTLCRLYFKLDQPGSCANVFSNIGTAKITFAKYSRAERVEFRYWLGRFYLSKNKFADSYRHLRWAFDNCLLRAVHNRRLILSHLVPAAMLVGILPSHYLLELYQLSAQYAPLVASLKSGNYTAFVNHIDSNIQWFLPRGLVICLKSYSMVIFARILLYKVWNILGRKATVPLAAFQKAIDLSLNNEPMDSKYNHDLEEVESISVNLISQGYVKANIFPRNRVLRLRANDPFEKIPTVRGLWEESHEKWMD